MYKPGVVVTVCTKSLKVFSLVRIPVSSGEKNDPHKKIIDINLTLWSSLFAYKPGFRWLNPGVIWKKNYPRKKIDT